MADERQGDFLITLASEDDKQRQGTTLDVLFSIAGHALFIGFRPT